MTAFTVLDAPSNLGLRPPAAGVEPGARRLADALRACGLVERLGARDAGRVAAPPYEPDVAVNRAAIPDYTRALADRIGELLDAGWSDGVGAVAGEDLAVVTGRAEPELADLDGLGPYVSDADVVTFGERERDAGERAAIASTAITVRDLAALRSGAELPLPHSPYWVHVDADVIDSAVLPAVDSPAPDGLSFGELAALLRRLVDGGAVGVQVTIFDPDLDRDGSQARALTDCLVGALRS